MDGKTSACVIVAVNSLGAGHGARLAFSRPTFCKMAQRNRPAWNGESLKLFSYIWAKAEHEDAGEWAAVLRDKWKMAAYEQGGE